MKSFFQHLRTAYGSMKLQSKFTLILALAVLLPMVFFGVLYYSTLEDMIISNTIRTAQDLTLQTSPKLENIIHEITAASERISNYTFYETLFEKPLNQSPSDLEKDEDMKIFREYIDCLLVNPNIQAIRIYLDLPEEYHSFFDNEYAKSIFVPSKKIAGTYWHGIFSTQKYNQLYCPSFYLGAKERAECGEYAYIRRASITINDSSTPAYIAVYGNEKSLVQELKNNLTLDGSVSYIINDRDSIVASSDKSLSGIYLLSYDTIRNAFMSSNNFIEREILGITVFAEFYNIREANWFLVTVLPYPPLLLESQHIILRIAIIYLAFLVIAIFFSTFMSKSITQRLSSVIHQMQKVRYGIPKALPSPEAHDEVGNLIDTYNYMTRKMTQLMDDQAAAAEDLRIAEFNTLQAQINPHFLYNTMDMINWLAQQGRTPEISEAVQNLSKFYKLTLSKKNSISTIAQEIQHISIYVHLQNMRFHDNIELITDIPDELNEYQIPKLTLQPVVENAILHGILEKENKSGTIVITGWMEGTDIVILISDDGVGIPNQILISILDGVEHNTSSKGSNIAIYNTHKRIQILYGPKYGMHYESIPEKGTEVEIRIPARRLSTSDGTLFN